jgi:hypothetical protein
VGSTCSSLFVGVQRGRMSLCFCPRIMLSPLYRFSYYLTVHSFYPDGVRVGPACYIKWAHPIGAPVGELTRKTEWTQAVEERC